MTTTLRQADQDGALSPEAKALVVRALTGLELDGDDDAPGEARSAGSAAPAATASRAYVSAITVEGFRGIGPQAVLRFPPRPGLTVVAGRNGSGKSSFAEAAELALTAGSYRWRNRSAVFRQAWRNLHRAHPTQIQVELAVEGNGKIVVGTTWAAGAEAKSCSVWTQRPGEQRQDGVSALGWGRAIELHRPFLCHDELAGVFAEPSRLHDELAPVLGLERFDDAATRLADLVKRLGEPARAASSSLRIVRGQLASSTDPRAAQATALLKGKTPDLGKVSALATGAAAADPALALLKSLAALPLPDAAAWREARGRLTDATARKQRAEADLAAAAGTAATLLEDALAHHTEHGDGACPVCGIGTLDAGWAARARAQVDQAGLFRNALNDAKADVARARAALTTAVPHVPPALTQAAARTLPDIPAAQGAHQAWAALAAQAGLDGVTEETGTALFGSAATECEALRAQAAAAVAAREDAWQPLALALAGWLELARSAATAEPRLAAAKQAEAWLKANATALRNQRLAPLGERARAIWAQLRQESNVDLGLLRLEGSKTNRHVEMTATVDGQDAGAFAVMSQGELYALALSIFLPRATSPESPFGFVVVDDPVQAMDPAKVDGLARVLTDAAQDRQVIVFTHDDRLPEAIRRLQLPARILEVTRDQQSAVSIDSLSDPAQRYLDDARAIASDKNVPTEVLVRVVPELCRLAVESTCKDVFLRRRLLAGTPRAQAEDAWNAVNRTSARVALVVLDTPTADLGPWRTAKPWRTATLGICANAAHDGLRTDPHQAINHVAKTIEELARMATA